MQLFFGLIQFGLVALRYLIPFPAPAQNLERGPGDDADLADFLIQRLRPNNNQLLDEVEQNIVICRWRADQLFADAEGKGK